MKLLFCTQCHDIKKLQQEETYCQCRKSWGYYADGFNARYGGLAILLGINNLDFVKSLKEHEKRPNGKMGIRFDSFIIPANAPTIEKIEDKNN